MAEDRYSKIPEDLLREVVRNTQRSRERRGGKKPYPSNRDVELAVLEISGGVINRDLVDQLYSEVLELLRERGFEPRHVTERRLWRIVTTMVERKRLRIAGQEDHYIL